MAAKKVVQGRPAKLDDKLAFEIAALLLAGNSTSAVAQMLGVSRRSIAGWRRRAWSRDERDAPCVLLEQVLSRGRAATVEHEQRERAAAQQNLDVLVRDLEPLDELLADLEPLD